MTQEQAKLIRFAADHGFRAIPTDVLCEPAIALDIPWTRGEEQGTNTVIVDNMRDLKLELGY